MSVDTVLNKLKTIIASGDNYYRANNFSQAKMCYQQALGLVDQLKGIKIINKLFM